MDRPTKNFVMVLCAVAGIASSIAAQSSPKEPAEPAAHVQDGEQPLGEAEASPFDFTVAAAYIFQFDS